jgi:hypothetical protein
MGAAEELHGRVMDDTWPMPSWPRPTPVPKDVYDELGGPPYFIRSTDQCRITVHIREVREGVMIGDDEEPP